MSLGWKKFSFFEQTSRRNHEFPAAASRCCQGPDAIVVGCSDGSVALLDRNLQIQQAFQAHSKLVEFVVFLPVSEGSEQDFEYTGPRRDIHPRVSACRKRLC